MESPDLTPPIRIGLNGFGRIGRAVFRINALSKRFQIVAVNDIDPFLENHVHLLRYDSTYGRFAGDVRPGEGTCEVLVDGEPVRFYAEPSIADVPWEDHGVDVVIDASGVAENVLASRDLVEAGRVRKVVVTHSPKQGVDHVIIYGANDETYDDEAHHVVSTSICDSNASGPVLKRLDDAFGVESGYITTLHPWLSYQNLVDGSVRSVSSPGHHWTDFSLGRASTMSLIPKGTTLCGALDKVMPEIASRVEAVSFRVPTMIVSASDLVIRVGQDVTAEDVNALFAEAAAERPRIFGYGDDMLVSIDHAASEYSLFFDARWTKANKDRMVKMVVWYDNEWGYSQRVVDMAERVARPTLAAAEATAA